MLEIIKYQLKGRMGTILFLLAAFGIVNLVAWGAEIYGFATGMRSFTPLLAFWIPIAMAVTWITTVVMFFMCSSGHVNELLFKDTSYLMLTVPRRGWQILGGRLVAGLIEFLMYALPMFVIMSVHAAAGTVFATDGKTGFFAAMAFVYRDVFGNNILSLVKLLLLGLSMFVSTGVLILFAGVATRSFVKTKKLAIAIGIVVFITISNWSVKLGSWMSETLGWYVNVPVSVATRQFGGMNGFAGGGMPETIGQQCSIPLAPFLIFIVIAAILFACASWLMEKKVEL
jgi:hypothetical protein